MYADDWAAWHEAHESRRAAPHGFLAVTGLHWLSPDWQTFDDVPGSWRGGPDGVWVRLPGGEGVAGPDSDSGPGPGPGPGPGLVDLGVVDEDGVDLMIGEVLAEVALRGSMVMLRPRNPRNPARFAYRGTPAFPPDEKWIVIGRFVDEPREVTVGTVIDGLEELNAAPGRVEFELGGMPLSLTVFAGNRPGGLTALFRDATSGVTTYPASRTLQIPPPAADGTVVIDFNRATNLPCAYTEFATCSLAPPENTLPIAVEAGEQMPPVS
jgi:uncharacterized protein (DUF1684 family)